MVNRANAAYFGTTGKLTVEADDYTAAVTSCALVPTAPTAQVRDIGGGISQFVGSNAWVAQIGYNQDWKTANSLSQQLIAWHGQTKTFTYTPDNGGQVATFTARVMAGQFGGAAATLHSATVNLPLNGQPAFAPGV